MAKRHEVSRPFPWYRLRERAYDVIYVSPHMDDAVYSCAGQIARARAQGARILIVTLFGTGSNEESGTGLFDNIAQRKREERAACDLLDVDHVWLNLPDMLSRKMGPLELLGYWAMAERLPERPLRRQARVALHALVLRLLEPRGELLFPLAIGAHPDHREVYELGRAFHSEFASRLRFYEDIPYAQVAALRRARLRQFGFAFPPSKLLAEAREVGAFVFPREAGPRRQLGQALAGAQLASMRALSRIRGNRDPIAARLSLHEHDIGSVIDEKVAAMRAYETQTAFFYPAGDEIYSALREADGRYLERTWTLAPDASERPQLIDPLALARILEHVDALERA